MGSFYNIMYNGIKPYLTYITIAVILIIFIQVLKFTYERYFNKPKDERKFKDVANANTRGEELEIYMFHVDWCPHCKTAMPEWKSFTDTYNNKQIRGYNIRCIDVNCTNENPSVTSYINQYNIESYPTIKMIKEGEQIDFDARITSDNLETFIDTMV